MQQTSNCIPIERFGAELTAEERNHISGCARCQAELALWKEFRDATPVPDEGAAVQWVVAELERRRAEPQLQARRGAWSPGHLVRSRGFAAAAATLVLAAAIGYVTWDREPSIESLPAEQEIYRTARLEVLAPVGDVSEAPRALTWAAVDGAASYDVQLLEVDRNVLWRGASPATRVDLPADVVKQLVPGKTVLWEVTARSASGTVLAQSGTQRFRVRISR